MIDSRTTRRKLLSFVFIIFGFVTVTLMLKNSGSTEITVNNGNSTLLSSTSCQHVSVEELDQWFHSKQWNEIPKIIHQTWKTKKLRPRQEQWSQTWCDQYSGWRYHLWTDEENDLFVKTKFPWFYPTYKQLAPAILQADSVRYLYMFYYGGLYLDLDYESIRRVDQFFVNKSVVFSLINYSFDSKNSIPNSWMVSRPNHPLWTYVTHRTMVLWYRTSEKERTTYWNGKAEYFTGPQTLFEALMFYLHSMKHTDLPMEELMGSKDKRTEDAVLEVADITFLGPKFLNAYDWMTGFGYDVCSAERPTFDADKCKDKVKPIYGITYWSHSYGNGHQNDSNYLGK